MLHSEKKHTHNFSPCLEFPAHPFHLAIFPPSFSIFSVSCTALYSCNFPLSSLSFSSPGLRNCILFNFFSPPLNFTNYLQSQARNGRFFGMGVSVPPKWCGFWNSYSLLTLLYFLPWSQFQLEESLFSPQNVTEKLIILQSLSPVEKLHLKMLATMSIKKHPLNISDYILGSQLMQRVMS